uniref:Uncharacterized protein n=1 Tax=Cyanothece sp. (strain PCC 7425 / ATCC 29141) TaxID=395961 RepID=B8HQ56_CYAP4
MIRFRNRLLLHDRFYPKNSTSQQGFSLPEVMVGMLIMLIFVAMGGQLMFFSATYRQLSRERAQVVAAVQEEIEKVRDRAAQLDASGNTYNPVPARCNNAYGSALNTDIGTAVPAPVTYTTSAGRTFSIARTTAANNNILQLTYTATPTGGGTTTTVTLRTEVIPYAVLYCR